ncbi:hypothetical protein F01_200230 [Burkholderia cenocepacia]|nr:hypothetical protein F01_200230 [Burkholderia cenocepacia]
MRHPRRPEDADPARRDPEVQSHRLHRQRPDGRPGLERPGMLGFRRPGHWVVVGAARR